MSKHFDDASRAIDSLYEIIANYENENYQLSKFVKDVYAKFYGVVFDGWSYSTVDFHMIENRMQELGIEVPRHE